MAQLPKVFNYDSIVRREPLKRSTSVTSKSTVFRIKKPNEEDILERHNRVGFTSKQKSRGNINFKLRRINELIKSSRQARKTAEKRWRTVDTCRTTPRKFGQNDKVNDVSHFNAYFLEYRCK